MGTIAVKNVDESLYRRVKALASLRGRTVGEEVSEALAMWLGQKTTVDLLDKWDELERQAATNNKLFEKIRSDLLAKHPDEYAVVASGRVLGIYRGEEEAYRAASKLGGAQAIVAELKAGEPRVVEIGLSLLEGVVR